jgi:CheY-like chemotaxis protein
VYPPLAVTGVVDGWEALSIHATHLPDVTLMDLRILTMDGIAAIQASWRRTRARASWR